MDPFTIVAATKIVSFLGEKAFEEVFETTVSEVTQDGIKWIKSLFFQKDGQPKEVLERLQEKPSSLARQNAAKAVIESELEDNPQVEKYLIELVKAIEAKSGNRSSISNSKNVNTGTIHSGGNVTFGDNNY